MLVEQSIREIAVVWSDPLWEFDGASSWLWDPMGQALVDLTAPLPGERVLDACCGAGASALPAARQVGSTGRVHAVDLADEMVRFGRQRAAKRGITAVDFVTADVTTWDSPRPYDLVQCAYGIFFLPDMDVSARRLIQQLASGGRFGISAWWRPALESFGAALLDAVTPFHPEARSCCVSDPAHAACQRISTPETLHYWLNSLGLNDIGVRSLKYTVTLTPQRAWNFVLASDFRASLALLDCDTRYVVRDAFITTLAKRHITELDISTLIGRGTRPEQGI